MVGGQEFNLGQIQFVALWLYMNLKFRDQIGARHGFGGSVPTDAVTAFETTEE